MLSRAPGAPTRQEISLGEGILFGAGSGGASPCPSHVAADPKPGFVSRSCSPWQHPLRQECGRGQSRESGSAASCPEPRPSASFQREHLCVNGKRRFPARRQRVSDSLCSPGSAVRAACTPDPPPQPEEPKNIPKSAFAKALLLPRAARCFGMLVPIAKVSFQTQRALERMMNEQCRICKCAVLISSGPAKHQHGGSGGAPSLG